MQISKKVVMIGLAATVCLSVALLCCFNQNNESVRMIKVVDIDGEVTVARGEIDDLAGHESMLLEIGDTLYIGEEGYCRLLIDDDKYLYVSQNSSIQIQGEDASNTEIVVLEGMVINEIITDLEDEETYNVTTPNASLSVRGTTFAVEVYLSGDLYYTRLTTLEGTVTSDLINLDGELEQTLLVESGYEVKIESKTETYVKYLLEEMNNTELWDLDLTTMSVDMLELISLCIDSGTNQISIEKEDIESELVRRETLEEYVLTAVLFDDETVEYILKENAMIEIEVPEVVGYSFKGWYLDETYETTFSSYLMPDEDMTLYGLFEKDEYVLTLKDGDSQTTMSYYYLDTLVLSKPTSSYATFIGWFDETGQEVTNMPASNLTLYASWESNEYILTLDSGSSSIESNYTYGEKISLEALTKSGYIFLGWYDNSNVKWNNNDTMPNYNLFLTALWQEVDDTNDDEATKEDDDTNDNVVMYTLTQINGSDKTVSSYEYGDKVVLSTPSLEGYTFSGWYDSDGVKWVSGDTMPSKNVSLNAKWIINSYSLTLDDGTNTTTNLQTYGNTIDDPILSGYTFKGWYDATGTQFTTMPSYDLSLTAKWTINSYYFSVYSSVNYSVKSAYVDYGTSVSDALSKSKFTEMTVDGYEIDGYYTTSNFTSGSEVLPSDVITEELNIYAKWVKIN